MRTRTRASGSVGPVLAVLGQLGSHSSTAERRARERILRLKEVVFPGLVYAVRRHPNAFARSVAASALAQFGSRARPALLRALRDPAMPVRLSALVAVDHLWNRTVERAILRLLKDPSGGIRVNAVDVLVRHRVRGAAGTLIRMLGDPKWYVRLEAARGLGILEEGRARVSLTRALRDPSKAVRRGARDALARLTHRVGVGSHR